MLKLTVEVVKFFQYKDEKGYNCKNLRKECIQRNNLKSLKKKFFFLRLIAFLGPAWWCRILDRMWKVISSTLSRRTERVWSWEFRGSGLSFKKPSSVTHPFSQPETPHLIPPSPKEKYSQRGDSSKLQPFTFKALYGLNGQRKMSAIRHINVAHGKQH